MRKWEDEKKQLLLKEYLLEKNKSRFTYYGHVCWAQDPHPVQQTCELCVLNSHMHDACWGLPCLPACPDGHHLQVSGILLQESPQALDNGVEGVYITLAILLLPTHSFPHPQPFNRAPFIPSCSLSLSPLHLPLVRGTSAPCSASPVASPP